MFTEAQHTEIKTNRDLLLRFLKSEEPKFQFSVTGELDKRIRYIYRIIFPGFKKYAFYGRFMVASLAQFTSLSGLKVLLYRLIGVKIGKGVYISPDVIIDPHFPSLIRIDEYAILGWGAKLFHHDFDGETYSLGRIRIKKGAVIGAYTIIRGGVTVGERAFVPPRTAVHRSLPDNYKPGLSALKESIK